MESHVTSEKMKLYLNDDIEEDVLDLSIQLLSRIHNRKVPIEKTIKALSFIFSSLISKLENQEEIIDDFCFLVRDNIDYINLKHENIYDGKHP